MPNTNKSRGFTLLELIMVMVTIGVLVLVLVPNILLSKQRAFDAQTKACLKEISAAQNVYFISEFTYATDTKNMPAYPERTCHGVDIKSLMITNNEFKYRAHHEQSDNIFYIQTNQGVSNTP